MPDEGFSALFRAIERIRQQLVTADTALKTSLQAELSDLRDVGIQYLDQWLTLDEQIQELELVFGQNSPTMTSASAASVNPLSASNIYAPTPPQPETFNMTLKHPLPPANPLSRTGKDTTMQFPRTPSSPSSTDSIQLESVLFDQANHAEVSLRKGMAYYELLMYGQASSSLEEAVREIDLPATRLYLAAAYAAQNHVEAALYHLSQVRAASNHPQILCAALEIEAHVQLVQQNTEGAIRCYLDIVSSAPNYDDVWYNLGLCYLAANEPIGAERVLLQAAQRNPRDAETMLWLTYAKYQQNAYTEAYTLCAQAIKQFPRNYELLAMQSSICKQLGCYDVGEAMSRRMVHIAPERPDGYLHIAWYLLQQHNSGGAVAILKKLICLCPTHIQAIAQLGVACLQAKDETRAELLLQTISNEESAPTIVSIALGRIASLRGNRAQAFEYLAPSLNSPERSVKRIALYYYGCCLMELQDFGEAEKYMRAADVMGEPNNAILHALIDITQALGRTREANRYMERARALR